MNRQKSLATDDGFYNEKTLTVPLRNVSKLVRREDHLLNKTPNSMLLESRFQLISFHDWRHSRLSSNWSALLHEIPLHL